MNVFCFFFFFSRRIETVKKKTESQMEKRRAVEKTVDNLYDWIDEQHVELNASNEAQ